MKSSTLRGMSLRGLHTRTRGDFLSLSPFFEGVYIPISILLSLWELDPDVTYFIINCLSLRPRHQIVVTCNSGISASILIKFISTSRCRTSAATIR